jgi:hypothetical protein
MTILWIIVRDANKIGHQLKQKDEIIAQTFINVGTINLNSSLSSMSAYISSSATNGSSANILSPSTATTPNQIKVTLPLHPPRKTCSYSFPLLPLFF